MYDILHVLVEKNPQALKKEDLEMAIAGCKERSLVHVV